MNSMLTVVLVHRDDYERGQLRLALEGLSGTLADGAEGVACLRALRVREVAADADDGENSENADDRDDDHEFDEGEAFVPAAIQDSHGG